MFSEPVSAALRLLSRAAAGALFVLCAFAATAQQVPDDFPDVTPTPPPVTTPDVPTTPTTPPVTTPDPTPTPTPPPVSSPDNSLSRSSFSNIHESLPGVIPVFGVDQSNQVLPLDATLAANIATSISAAVSFCEALPKAYLVDCMGERLDWIATTLPAGTANDEIRKVLDDASRKIEKVARENRDRSQPRIRVKTPGPNPVSTSRPLIAVKPEAQAAAVAETAAILEEASALLLRSSSRSQEHAEHYRTIAAALDSSALLLRS